MPSLIMILRCWLQLLLLLHLHSFILCLSLRTKTSGIQGNGWTESSSGTGKISWAIIKSKGKTPSEHSQTFLNSSYVKECLHIKYCPAPRLSNLEFSCRNRTVGTSEMIENSLCEGFLALENRPLVSFGDIQAFKFGCLPDIEKRSVMLSMHNILTLKPPTLQPYDQVELWCECVVKSKQSMKLLF